MILWKVFLMKSICSIIIIPHSEVCSQLTWVKRDTKDCGAPKTGAGCVGHMGLSKE